MDFFEPPPLSAQPPEPPRYRMPEWMGPPENVAPATAQLDLVLVNAGGVAVLVTGALVYPTGVEMTLTALFREESETDDPLGMRPFHHRRGRPADGEIPPEILRFGLQFSDGRKATNIGGPPHFKAARPDGPTLTPCGGSGGGRRWDQRLWAWPLPPAGEVLFACEWPAKGVQLTTASIDAEVIMSAATRAHELWPTPELPELPLHASEE
jgi:hypothetical protein